MKAQTNHFAECVVKCGIKGLEVQSKRAINCEPKVEEALSKKDTAKHPFA